MNLGEASARITLDISDLAGKSAQAQGILTDLDSAAGRSTSGFGKFTNALAGFGTAMIAPVTVGLKAAIDLEQAMANVNASLGGLDAATLAELEQGFMDVGSASQFSAVEVAAVGDELARAGFDPSVIVAMAESVVMLSQATGTDLMTSVSGVTSVMNLWNASVVDSTIAMTDAARVADIYTVAANASSAEVGDIIAGVRNLGPMAASLQIPFEDTAGAIAFFTNNGMKAADAGISITRGLQELLSPTAEAQAEMDRLGISAFDLEGNFVGLPTLFDQLQAAYADMSPAARAASMDLIFGAESIDAMTIAALNGGDPLRVILGLMDETGIAAEQSALRMDTLKAQFGELAESVTNLLSRMMSGVTPVLRGLVDIANMVVNALSRIPEPILAAVGAVMALSAAFATLRGAAAGLQLLQRFTGFAIPGGALFGGLAPALLAIAAAAGVAYAAIRFNLFGIGDAVNKFISIWSKLADSAANNSLSRFLIALGQALQTFDIAALDRIGRGLDVLGKGVNAFFDGFRGPGAKDVEATTKHFEGFAELAEDGVTWKVKSEGGEEIGEIIDSVTDLETGETTVTIRTKGGEEFETTIDMATGFVSDDYEVEIEVDAKDARNTIEKLIDGFDGMTRSLEKSAFPALARFPRFMGNVLRGVDMLTEHFGYFRRMGLDPVNAALVSVGQVFPSLAGEMQAAQRLVNDFTADFQHFRDQGLNPVEAGIMALGTTFPRLQTAMVGLFGVVDGLGNAFGAALRGDWAGAFEGLEQAARSAWVVIGEIVGGIGGLVADLWDWTINVGVPAITGWLADNAGNIGSAILDAAGWVWDNIIVPIGQVTLDVLDWLVTSGVNIWNKIAAFVLGGGTGPGSLGATVGNAAGGGGAIPVGPVAIQVVDWIVDSAVSVWNRIAQWVLGTGDGMTGGGRMAGGGLASAAGTGIPVGPVAIQITEWDVVADAVDIYQAIYEWVDESLTVTDAEAARWEPIGREIGASIMRKLIDGIVGAFGGGGGGGAGTGGGGGALSTAVGIASGASVGAALWAFIQPILEGAWDELQPELENWGTQLKRDVQQWWNGFAPTLLQFDTLAGSPLQQGGDAAFGGLADAIAGPSVFEKLRQDIEGKWEDFTGWLDGFDFSISMPTIDIDWGSFGAPIAEGWQDTMTLFQNIIDWVKNPWQNVGSIDISFPSIKIDWPDPPDVPEWLDQLLSDPVGWLKDKVGFGESDTPSGGDPFGIQAQVDAAFETIRKVRDAAARLGVSASPSGGWGGPRSGPLPGLGILSGLIPSADAVGRAVSSAFAGVPASINGALSAASSQIGAFARQLGAIPDVSMTVTADTTQATAAMAAAQAIHAGLNGAASTVQVLGDNAGALAAVDGAAAALGGINGQIAQTYVNGDNSNALGAVMGAAAAMAGFDGTVATGYLEAVNNVGAAVADAMNALMSIDGMTATAYVNVVQSGGAGIGGAIPGFASGGTVRSPWAIVGEQGPELVALPYGSYVNNANSTRQMLSSRGGGDTHIHVHVERAYGIDDLAGQVFEIGLPRLADEHERHLVATGVR